MKTKIIPHKKKQDNKLNIEIWQIAQKVNPRKDPLTIEKLRSFPGCEHYSDQEAIAIIETFEQLAFMTFEYTLHNPTYFENNQAISSCKAGTSLQITRNNINKIAA